jgi:hypothetical protein
MFMVDDFTNVWIDLNGNGRVDPGEDWGHAMDDPGSAFRFLTEEVLKDLPSVKVTFFTPVARVPVIKDHGYDAHFAPINESERTADFFRSVHRDERFEVAYHGLTHGINGAKTEDFIHEWVAFGSLEEALQTIEKGKQIYFDVFGEYPSGGKYCGYEYNEFSDESIDRSGFLWWCRKWDRGQAETHDITSTVYGALFNVHGRNSIARALKRAGVLKRGKDEIDRLLDDKLVISIQEHLSPARTDGRRQTPNTFDDKEGLKALFEYLNSKNVWYCTGTELAEYVYCRENIRISEEETSFSFDFASSKHIAAKHITLVIKDEKVQQIRTPSGDVVRGERGVFNLPIVPGRYELL